MDLFAFPAPNDGQINAHEPLASRMRPRTLDEFLGQEQILAAGSMLRRAIDQDRFGSMIFYGPPGCGKTTLAQLISVHSKARFVRLNAVEASVKDVREAIEQASEARVLYGQKTILFLDEVHRFNSARQDVLLPTVEKGELIFIGATTERPVHYINDALLSRCTIIEFAPLDVAQITSAVVAAISDETRGLGTLPLVIERAALNDLAEAANGDVRRALNALETAARCSLPDESGMLTITKAIIAEAVREPLVRANKTTQYDVLSAFHKSVRGSSADAALWFMYGVEKLGMDPQVFVRRLVVACAEDIGLADPQAMLQATAAYTVFERIGWPEAKYNIMQAIQYAVGAPKSRGVANEIARVTEQINNQIEFVVPRHLRNY
jgi:putative ATPase